MDWITVTTAPGEQGYIRADLVACVFPGRRGGGARVHLTVDDDPVDVLNTAAEVAAMLTPRVSLCPQCGGTGSEIIAGAFVPCGTCDGDGRI